MSDLFTKILARGIARGIAPARSEEARDWFRNKSMIGRVHNRKRLIASAAKNDRARVVPTVGRMMFFQYDPKTKDDLPYWDKYPIIFPIDVGSTSMLGINFHYLPLNQRAQLMDALYSLTNNKKYDETTKLKISYEVLKSASKFKEFQPCIKRYLYSHIRSPLIEVYAAEYDIALFLPLAAFQKATAATVWKDSLKSIR